MKTALINITEQNGKRAVSARELHQFLEVQSKFATWIERRIEEYGFVENQDFVCISQNWETQRKSGQKGVTISKEYVISLDMAKELSMVERTEKGRQARRYFIEMEKMAQEKLLLPSFKKTNRNSLSEKRVELINTIRTYLKWGDMHKVAKEMNINTSYIKRVAVDKVHNTEQADRVVEALYHRALQNKKEALFEYQKMIDTLNN